MEKIEEKTEEEIVVAYEFARNLARQMYNGFHIQTYRPHLELEDFAQEGILAWLEGRNMYLAMLDYMRANAALPRKYRVDNDLTDPIHVPFEEEMAESDSDPASEAEIRVDAEKILARIQSIKDTNVRFAVLAKLYFDMSYRELAKVTGLSHEGVRKLVDPQIQKIKKEFES